MRPTQATGVSPGVQAAPPPYPYRGMDTTNIGPPHVRAPLLARGLARRGRRAGGRGGRDDVGVVAAHEIGAHCRRLLLQHRVQRPRLADACAPGRPRPLRPVILPQCPAVTPPP